ncbi:MAG: hypothetical protein ACRCZO_16180 [Cetobacterium sp.]
MFKPGQLVRSLNTGCMYYVHDVLSGGKLDLGYVSASGVGAGYIRPSRRLEIIGNNFKFKR